MKQKVGIGMIGTGFARRVQTPWFLACEGAHIASVASGSLTNAEAAAGECGAAHFTDDWRETVSRSDVDLVCITTPPKLHREMTLFALEQGKHILCEKPMAMNVAEAEEMTAAASGTSQLALIDHELRFQPGRLQALSMLREGVIGKVRHAKAVFQAPHRGDPDIPWNWWSDVNKGGGALGAIASHCIDSLHYFLETDIASLSCQLQTHVKKRRDSSGKVRDVTADDESNMLLRFRDGARTHDATGLVSISMSEYPEYRNTTDFYGETGAMRIDHLGRVSVVGSKDTEWTDVDVDLGKPLTGVPDTGFARAFGDFAPLIVNAIRNGDTHIENAATFNDGLRVQRVLDAARESDREGRVVVI